MHELFLMAVMPDADLERAQALLQGLSGMTAQRSLHRVMFYAGPPQPRGLAIKRLNPAPSQQRLWADLHQQMTRSSFILQARYAIKPEDLGQQQQQNQSQPLLNASIASGSIPGMLRWQDLPDPTSSSNAVGILRLTTQRKKIDIPELRNLPTLLAENNYQFKSEMIEESITFFNNGTEYALVRYHRLPGVVSAPTEQAPQGAPVPLTALPSWDELRSPGLCLDPSGQWLLFVRRHVVEDTSPEKMKKALELLDGAHTQLTGVFEFRAVDRRAHDTRIERPLNNMPAPLPQKIRA
ncbi:mediator complex subunit med18 [Ophiostoma piceae UAMH 11346]|uniref:Mediator of RNA polymerase II transcription subunit 18 n=1 Tax=Ophiostoma piceae (strain UAMH 11346) TaxID=1262450 RepID=S3CRX7_OPHP1|nr:mediator complex subunit med18 [Ophiostoma piceae UAMH 11346]